MLSPLGLPVGATSYTYTYPLYTRPHPTAQAIEMARLADIDTTAAEARLQELRLEQASAPLTAALATSNAFAAGGHITDRLTVGDVVTVGTRRGTIVRDDRDGAPYKARPASKMGVPNYSCTHPPLG